MSLVVALFSKFCLWSFNVIKHSSLPLTWVLSRMFFLLAIFLPCSLMVSVTLEFIYVYVYVYVYIYIYTHIYIYIYIYIYYIYIYIFINTILFSEAVLRGFSYGRVCSGSMRRVCGVASVPKCDFNRVGTQLCWGHTSPWVFSCEFAPYFQGTSLCEDINLSFAKALLSSIVHFKGTFTYCYHCFVHDSHIFNISQPLLIICNSSYICVSCVHRSCVVFFR